METITVSLEKILDNLEAIGGIELSAIVSKQGLLMVSRKTATEDNDEAFAALTATLFVSSESTTLRICDEKPKSVVVETEGKHLITYVAGPDALIVVLVGEGGFIGLILNELKKAAEKVRMILQ